MTIELVNIPEWKIKKLPPIEKALIFRYNQK